MPVIEISQIDNAPEFIAKCYQRVTQNMVNCQVKVVSRSNLEEVNPEDHFSKFPWDKYEREAKFFYESDGFLVIRLEHFASSAVAVNEHIFPEAKILGGYLRKHLNGNDYAKYVFRKKSIRDATALNGIDPKDYSISFYPPDFLIVDRNSGKFKFVEVKGPADKLRFRQANWYINLIPEEWEYEIFASINRKFDDVYLLKKQDTRAGPKFKDEYEKQLESVNDYRKAKAIKQATQPAPLNRNGFLNIGLDALSPKNLQFLAGFILNTYKNMFGRQDDR